MGRKPVIKRIRTKRKYGKAWLTARYALKRCLQCVKKNERWPKILCKSCADKNAESCRKYYLRKKQNAERWNTGQNLSGNT